MDIGAVHIDGITALAPMAGVSDRAMRLICKRYGAAYTVGEMVSAKGMLFGDKKSEKLLMGDAEVRPHVVQLFGSEPETMAFAAKKALELSPDIIDINMGCPAPKITSSGSGSALMREPVLAGKIISAVAGAVGIPVTVKLRAGFTEENKNAVELAKIAQESGAAAITVHGRVREQFYSGCVDYDLIESVVNSVSIPVIGNGDVCDIQSAEKMLSTGCKMLMIGRAALGAPWLFAQLEAYFKTGEILPEPPYEQRMETLLAQVALMIENKGEYVAMREARKHAAWYFKGLPGMADIRRRAGAICVYDELRVLCGEALEIARRYMEE